MNLSGTLEAKSLRFGTDRMGLTPAQLSMMTYGSKRVALDAEGYVVVATGFLLLVQ